MFLMAFPSLLLTVLLSSNGAAVSVAAFAFAPGGARRTPLAKGIAPTTWRHQTPRSDVSKLYGSNHEDEPRSSPLFQRFLSPRIDDPGLPLTDVLIAQIVAPTFQIFWLFLNRAPSPSWLQPIGSYFGEAPELAPRGSFLAPTLIHGAGLAVCWLAGALAAKSFEREAFTVNSGTEEDDYDGRRSRQGQFSASGVFDVIARYDQILLRLFKAGAFASGVLIISTQADLLIENGGHWIQYGESDETDFRIFLASVEVINDIVWEALVISTWRIIHANFMSSPGNRLKRF